MQNYARYTGDVARGAFKIHPASKAATKQYTQTISSLQSSQVLRKEEKGITIRRKELL